MTWVGIQRFRTGCESMTLNMGNQKQGNKISDSGNSALEEGGPD